MSEDDSDGADGPERHDDRELSETYREAIEEGRVRLGRSWSNLLATGLMGGIDVSLGVLALFVIEEATGMTVLGGLGFTIGFIALTLGKSELFTVVSLEMFAALHAGADFGYGAWAVFAGWAALANMVGGLLLVTVIRLVQVGELGRATKV